MITERRPEVSSSAQRPGPQRQLGRLVSALGVVLLALLSGIFLADLVFPRPTI
jgi:hypothetical protein